MTTRSLAPGQANIVGLTVSDHLPVGVQHVRLSRGLTVLYGKNGVGKTRLLNAIGPLLRGGRRSFQSDEVAEGGTRNVSAPMAFYGRGGVHVHAPMTRTATPSKER